MPLPVGQTASGQVVMIAAVPGIVAREGVFG